MIVVPLTKSHEFWSLTPGREYVVIGVDHASYRVIDDKGEPISKTLLKLLTGQENTSPTLAAIPIKSTWLATRRADTSLHFWRQTNRGSRLWGAGSMTFAVWLR